ncbi:hypothetical protein Dda_6700 [Drechslerella dactyloides]|uniref:RING-type domain-containing protein n=1 Tax=Drechslerella dactyloides TaxID=74499 RepID=A0AAD6NHS7_DREDA|nr:hypothetical protein Dda_6700 [Drechslerella dactyloides]
MIPTWVLAILAAVPAVCNAASTDVGGGLAFTRFASSLPSFLANESIPDAVKSKLRPKALKARTGGGGHDGGSGGSDWCDSNLDACAREPFHTPGPFTYLEDPTGRRYRGSAELIGSQWWPITAYGDSKGWSRLTLPFPIQIFEKRQSEIYVSVDGIVSFEPFCRLNTVPERGQQLPTYRLPKHTIAPLWQDYWIPPNVADFVTYGQVWIDNEHGAKVRVAAIDWFVHSVPFATPTDSATTWIEVFWREDRPSAVCISFGLLDSQSVKGVTAALATPDCPLAMSSYREGAGYGHGGYHSDLPPAQLGDINIDPDEFPNVAQHLQHFHVGTHPTGSTTGSAGYPEDGTRHLFVGPNGSHYYTSEVPGSTATYTGYNYIQAPDSSSAPHAFAGALRSATDPNFHGMGYFDAWPTYPSYPMNMNYPSQASKRYTMPPADAAAGAYARPFALTTGTQNTATPTPQSAQSAFPPPTQLSLPPPPSPAISSSTNSSKARSEQPFPPNRRFSYDDGHTANLHDRIRRTYEQFMQGYEGRDRYDAIPSEGYPIHDPEALRGRRPASGYYKSAGDYVVPAGTIPRVGTKTPSHADAGPSRRPATTAAIHQSRPPPSRHSSSESGDAEPAYRPSGRYDTPDYNNPPRPKATKSRPNSFSYNRNDPRAIESDPAFRAYNISIAQDASSTPFGEPRSSTGSLGAAGVRYGTPAAIVHQGDRYYRDTYGDSRGAAGGGAIVHSANSRQGRTYNYAQQRSQPINEPGYPYYQASEDRDFDEHRRRNRSRSRYRAQTPAPPEERPVSEDERIYRISVAKSRPSSPSPQRRAKSRKRRDSPSPGRFRSKSRMRSRSRPRPEIIQEKNRRNGSPTRAGTPGSARPKTPMPEGVTTLRDPEEALRLKEIDRELNRIERDRVEREKIERVERDRAERLERDRAERQERERLERLEQERLERERLEKQERDKLERQERERQAREIYERQERERFEKQERERFEKQERERLEKQERERLEKQERERLERQERERLERQERERSERQERERQERQERERFEKQERERFEKQERERFEKQERERLERQEKERLERQAREKLDKQERERLEKLEQERAEIRSRQQPRVEDAEEEPEPQLPERPRRHRHRSHHRDYESQSTSSDQGERDSKHAERKREKERDPDRKRDRESKRDRERERDRDRDRYRERERERERDRERESARDRAREESRPKAEPSKVVDPALANPMVENLNPKRERAGVQPGQVFIRPDLLCAMRALKLCVVEEDPSDDHAHNRLLRLDCGHGYHEDCLRSTTSSKERIPMYMVDLEADKLWCEKCRAYKGKKAGM